MRNDVKDGTETKALLEYSTRTTTHPATKDDNDVEITYESGRARLRGVEICGGVCWNVTGTTEPGDEAADVAEVGELGIGDSWRRKRW